ncbi:YggT family protein [Alicyclobacillus mali]|uniref:YggT family protein n=1 Tax=Alicyclobacillus mali (ex Roth et al. 2021) TaxID=1123961 RepID=A0ABS0F2Q5_9BACL|nr:YggT family protein [Alicyclobacillus mali (ex Roth et al. 2021)]MBF8377585.1 YggT family protein [Alicyclobacillus mali (ex Roth et al. 2021)]MCL6488801.1 YggT family protein [Alicyclobacillus mali (ex Roth et al. 2021)]
MDGLADAVEWIFAVYFVVLLAGALVQMVPDWVHHPVGRWISACCEPYLWVFRRHLRPLRIGRLAVDVSWILAMVVFLVVEAGVDTTLTQLTTS